MEHYLSPDSSGATFDLFGPGHLAWLIAWALLATLLIRAGLRADETVRTRLRRAFALVLIADELILHGWRLGHGLWNVAEDLPLQMCGAMVWITSISFLVGTRRTYPFIYFFGIAGAIQGVLTPNSPHAFPHYLTVETLISHCMLVTGGLWVAIVEKYRPSLGHFWMIFGVLNAAALVMYFVNLGLGSNYLYVNAPPATTSLVDLLPAWPAYILYLELIAFACFFLLLAPYLAGRAWTGRSTAEPVMQQVD